MTLQIYRNPVRPDDASISASQSCCESILAHFEKAIDFPWNQQSSALLDQAIWLKEHLAALEVKR